MCIRDRPTGLLHTTGGAEVGVTAASATAITMEEVIDLFFSLKAPYRKNATFVVNDATVKAIRKLKDGQGQYLWQPSITQGTPDTILNRPVVTSQYMPIAAAGEKTILFGDLSYYWIADRQGRTFKRLNELYAANGQVGFLAWQDVYKRQIAESSWFDDDVTPKQFKSELYGSGSDTDDIIVKIHSPGGDCFAAAQIYNMLKEYPGKVSVHVDGLAASAASVIAMAGDEVCVSPVSVRCV